MTNMEDDNWVLCPPARQKKLHIMRREGTPLETLANIHVGITTLADTCYIFHQPEFNGEVALLRHPISSQPTPVEKDILRPIVKASTLKSATENQQRFILFPYEKINGRHHLIEEEQLRTHYPLAYAYLTSVKGMLDKRDRGKPNPVGWYAFGRSQGLDTSFGRKILTSPINLNPHFIVWNKPNYTFYSGYCIKYSGNLHWLAQQLNSENMAFYINTVSRRYQNNYKSYAKSFLRGFPLPQEERNLFHHR